MIKFFVSLAILTLPSLAGAEILINEIMYDAEGADTHKEWIELHNNGTLAVDIAAWHLYEDETHHGLAPDGFSLLEPGNYALIVQDIPSTRALFGNNIPLIKSSFSLNNTGESLALSDAEKTLQFQVSYTSNQGGNGNGKSLQLSAGSWIEAVPTPGAQNAANGSTTPPTTTVPSGGGGGSSSSKSDSSSASVKAVQLDKDDVDYYEGFLEFGEQKIAGSPVEMEVFVQHRLNGKTTKLLRGSYALNFGDGTLFTSNKRFNTSHTYEHPGSYEVQLTFFRNEGRLFPEEKPEVSLRKTIVIFPHAVEIESISEKGDILLVNKSGSDVDVGGWSIVSSTGSYRFPPMSYLKNDQTMTLDASVHAIPFLSPKSFVQMVNNTATEVSQYPNQKKPPATTESSFVKNSHTQPGQEAKVLNTEPSYPEGLETSQSHLDQFLREHPEKTEVSFESYPSFFESAEQERPQDDPFPKILLLSFGALSLVLVVVRLFSYRKEEEIPQSTVLGEIELIE